jgi:hypothetical protein
VPWRFSDAGSSRAPPATTCRASEKAAQMQSHKVGSKFRYCGF